MWVHRKTKKQRGGGSHTHHMHVQQTSAQLCYWRCKNQCSTGKAFPLLELGVRLPSVAFNYSLSLRPEESNWFSFRPPQRSRQTERLDLSLQRNVGWVHRHNSQSYFNGEAQKQSLNSHWSKFHGEKAETLLAMQSNTHSTHYPSIHYLVVI